MDILAILALVLVRRGRLKPSEAADLPLARARQLVEKALFPEPHHSDALNIWALVLHEQARAVPGEDIDRAPVMAFERFKAVCSATAQGSILTGWGTIIFAQADRTSGMDAGRLLRDAKQKYAEASSRDPLRSTYNLACVCARSGEFDECRQWLEKSGEPGRLITREGMAADPNLADVRNYPWFQLLLAE